MERASTSTISKAPTCLPTLTFRTLHFYFDTGRILHLHYLWHHHLKRRLIFSRDEPVHRSSALCLKEHSSIQHATFSTKAWQDILKDLDGRLSSSVLIAVPLLLGHSSRRCHPGLSLPVDQIQIVGAPSMDYTAAYSPSIRVWRVGEWLYHGQ